MDRIKMVDNILVDADGYFPPVAIFADENAEDAEMLVEKLNWVMKTFEAYRKEHKSLSLRQISAISIITDLQNEIRKLESEIEILKFDKKHRDSPGEIARAIQKFNSDESLTVAEILRDIINRCKND